MAGVGVALPMFEFNGFAAHIKKLFLLYYYVSYLYKLIFDHSQELKKLFAQLRQDGEHSRSQLGHLCAVPA